jgi:hypothetical protein
VGAFFTREPGATTRIMVFDEWNLEGEKPMSSQSAKEFEEFARDCVRLAERADTPELREKLLNLAREWMQAVMEDEDSDSAAQNRRPMATALRRDRRSQAVRPPSPHSDEAPSL